MTATWTSSSTISTIMRCSTGIPATTKEHKPFVDITLKGPPKNVNALGAKIILFAGGGIRTYEKYPVRGFLSSMRNPVHIGLDKTSIDSMFLIWPDNSFQRSASPKDSTRLTFA